MKQFLSLPNTEVFYQKMKLGTASVFAFRNGKDLHTLYMCKSDKTSVMLHTQPDGSYPETVFSYPALCAETIAHLRDKIVKQIATTLVGAEMFDMHKDVLVDTITDKLHL